MSDYSTVTTICRERPRGRAEVVGDRIIGVAGTPAAAPTPRRKQKPFRAELTCITSNNPWEEFVRLKIKLNRATFENFCALAAEQNRTVESLLRQSLIRSARVWNKKAKAAHDHA
jgi:hypothetical protein